jgi:5-bromo-4-chloroindolyl phosphate hydrolysis protein
VIEIDKDYDCYCCGKRLINAAPKVVLTFIVSLIVIIFAFVYMFVKGDVVIFAPIVAGVVGFWLPSPVQSSQSRKDALQSARLMQNNMRMNKLMMRYGIVDRNINYGTYQRV